jgi:hypothetical protein
MMYGSIEAAEELETTPRLLRRFLRQNDSWKNATQAGRYSFTESELKSLRTQFDHWQRTRLSRKSNKTAYVTTKELDYLDADQGITPEEMLSLKRDPIKRREVLERRLERHRKLNDRLQQCRAEGVLQ